MKVSLIARKEKLPLDTSKETKTDNETKNSFDELAPKANIQ